MNLLDCPVFQEFLKFISVCFSHATIEMRGFLFDTNSVFSNGLQIYLPSYI